MSVRYMAAAVVAGILALNWALTSRLEAAETTQIAGGDGTDRATDKQLRDAGQKMVPADGMRKSATRSEDMKKPAPAPEPEPKLQAAPEAKPVEMMKRVKAEPAQPTMRKAVDISGPYVRADIGYGYASDPDGSQTAGATTNESIGGFGVFGAGLGYRIDKNIRADVTVDYRPAADVDSTSATGNTNASDVEGLAVLVNGYYDLGQYDMINPYVGIGVGYARLKTGNQTTTGGVASETGTSSSNFAWAATTGAAVDITEHTAVDLGYRYVDLGEFEQSGGTTTYDRLAVHEFRIGLRHEF